MSTASKLGTALITGASTGIGATYADRLARRGYDLILVARNKAKLEKLAARLAAETGSKVRALPADLTVDADLHRIEALLRDDPSIALLINNAGSATLGALASADIERLDRDILLNIVAPTRLSHAVLPGFIARNRGTLINIASVMSQMVLPGATRTALWDGSGVELADLPAEIVMDVDEMVDAALTGFDQGELITVPSLPDAGDWQRLTKAREALLPNLSRKHAAARLKPSSAAA